MTIPDNPLGLDGFEFVEFTGPGPIFFEIIQRKGNQGVGEGDFKALFESIERDQIRRGIPAAAQHDGRS